MGYEKVKEIAELFKKELKENLISVIIHGSFAQDYAYKNSDIDYFLILKKLDLNILERTKKVKLRAEKNYNLKLSINIQKLAEMPKYRGKVFYHKNRAALFLHEANKIDKVILGTNPYKIDRLPSHQELKVESIKIINSFAYFLRKFIVNSNLDYSLKEATRYVIMATQYANAFEGRYPTKTKEAVELFPRLFKNFKLKDLPTKLFKYKRGEIELDKRKILKDSLLFLESLDELLFKKYSN